MTNAKNHACTSSLEVAGAEIMTENLITSISKQATMLV